MRLYLMRHAEAVPHGTAGFARDADRPLTEDGVAEARAVAKGLKRLKKSFDVIVSSPYVRAKQTASEVARVLGLGAPIEELDALRSEAAPRETSLAIKVFAKYAHVICVGHEPHLSRWFAELAAGSDDGLRCVFKKAGVACVEVDCVPPRAGSGTLRWFMTPKQMTLIGKS